MCGSALLPAIIAFCKNCINHVVTKHKALIGISLQKRDSQCEWTGWGCCGGGKNRQQEAMSNMKPGCMLRGGGDKKMSRLNRKMQGLTGSAVVVFALAVAYKQITSYLSS